MQGARVDGVREHGQREALVVGAGGVPERHLQRVRQPVAKPWRPVVVVHGEQAVSRVQVGLGRFHGLEGEQVAFQPQRGLPSHQGQRVGQGEQDHVVLGVRLLQEGPAVVDVHGDPGILVRMIRVQPLAQLVKLGIDLYRVDVLGALQEGVRHVVAGSGADDQDVAERVAWCVQIRLGVDLLQLAGRDDVLVRDPVDVDGIPIAGLDHRDAVVGRPDVAGGQRFRPEQHHQAHDRGDLEKTGARAVKQQHDGRDHERPDDRLRVEERQQRKGRDAGDAANDVQPVGIQRPEPDEGPGDALTDHFHDGGHGQEHDGQCDPRRGTAGVEPPVAEEQELVTGSDDLDREHPDEQDQQGQRHRGKGEEVHPGPGPQEPDADAQEAAEQDEIGEVRQVDDQRAGPADQGQLDEQHQEAEHEELRRERQQRSPAGPRASVVGGAGR